MWLFHHHSAVKIQPFYPVFPLAGATAKAFCRLSLWSFKEKKHQPFSITQPSRITEPCAGQRGFRPDKKPFPVHYRGEGLNQPLTVIKGAVSPPSPGMKEAMRHGPHPPTVPQTVFLPQFKTENSTNYIFCYFPAKKACQVPQTRLLNDLAAAAATCGKVAQLVRAYGSYP